MDTENTHSRLSKEKLKEVKLAKIWGTIYFFIFFTLIISGIVQKRVYHQEGLMMLWHVPAAVFLVLSGRNWGNARRLEFFFTKFSS